MGGGLAEDGLGLAGGVVTGVGGSPEMGSSPSQAIFSPPTIDANNPPQPGGLGPRGRWGRARGGCRGSGLGEGLPGLGPVVGGGRGWVAGVGGGLPASVAGGEKVTDDGEDFGWEG
ncbi:hypothetical protein TIFTF001_026400 [Ficus carica]|uniref:Uncharacterized protein n=1 Tax=Ficus carica TaxID=3494 RepID=A0AA88DL59_FICCA|nr:hypothetical protein TIFTF001_026400 [Ficus carica]